MPQCILSSPSPPPQLLPHAPPCSQGPGKPLHALPLLPAAAFRDHGDSSRPPADVPIPLLATIPSWTLHNFLLLSFPNHVFPPIPPSLTTSPPRPPPYPYGPLVHFVHPAGRSPLHHHHQPPLPVLPLGYSVDFLSHRPLPQPVPLRPRPLLPATPPACAPSRSPIPSPRPPALADNPFSSPSGTPTATSPPAYGARGPSLDCRYRSEGPDATHQSSLSIGHLPSILHAGREHLHPPGPRPTPEPAQAPDPPEPP